MSFDFGLPSERSCEEHRRTPNQMSPLAQGRGKLAHCAQELKLRHYLRPLCCMSHGMLNIICFDDFLLLKSEYRNQCQQPQYRFLWYKRGKIKQWFASAFLSWFTLRLFQTLHFLALKSEMYDFEIVLILEKSIEETSYFVIQFF